MGDQERARIEIANVSPLITKVEFAVIDGAETVYIHHKPKHEPNYYHCVHVSDHGLMVNSNGYHDLDLHGAMNEAVKIACQYLRILM